MRTHLANFDSFHEEVQETFLAYLYTRCDNGNHVHLPNLCAPILGRPTLVSGDVPMSGVTLPSDDGYYLEAWWAANPYLPTDHKFPLKYWAMDLLPACPLYQAIKYSWEMTMRKYASAQYAAFALRDEVLIPPFKQNLHWSVIAPSNDVLATPIDFATAFDVGHQQNHLR